MKKIIVILMIISISLSVFSCKRPADNDIGQIIVEPNTNDTAETEKTTEESFAPSAETESIKETESEPEPENETPAKTESAPQIETETETSTVIQTEPEEKPLGIEVSDEIKKLIDLKDYEYVDENGFVCLKEGYNESVDKYKYIRATREHILVEKGLVEKREEGGYTRFLAKSDSFILEFEVTKEIKEEAIYHRWNTDFSASSGSGWGLPITLEEYENDCISDKETIVRGHFAPELGKHFIHYKRIDDENNPFIVDFEVVKEYTVIPFTIDKVYGESDLKVGDVIDVRYSRPLSINMRNNGYLTGYGYTFFDTCEEKHRSYIASIKPEKDGTYSTGAIFQKAELELNTHDYDTLKELLDDVDEKYN